MQDREKVIKGVHDARRYFEDREWVDKSVGVHIDALNDALALLKEQEGTINELQNAYGYLQKQFFEAQDKLLKEQDAVEPYITGSGESFETAETWWYACGNCNEALDVNDKYCRHCGKPIDWESR